MKMDYRGFMMCFRVWLNGVGWRRKGVKICKGYCVVGMGGMKRLLVWMVLKKRVCCGLWRVILGL